MNNEQWFLLFIITVMLFNKASFFGASILSFSYVFYNHFIVDLSAIYYYSCAALLNLIIGMMLQQSNKQTAILSYLLVPINFFWLLLWYKYQPPLLYDRISLLILVLQVVTLAQKWRFDALRYYYECIMAKCAFFDCNKTRDTMPKVTQTKKT